MYKLTQLRKNPSLISNFLPGYQVLSIDPGEDRQVYETSVFIPSLRVASGHDFSQGMPQIMHLIILFF